MIFRIKKIFSILVSIAISISALCTGRSIFALSDSAKETVEDIISFSLIQSGAGSVQEWVDTALADGAGTTSEWYIIGLLQYNKNLDFSS